MDVEAAQTIGIIAGAVVAVGGALEVVRRFVLRPLVRAAKAIVRAAHEVREFLDDWRGDGSRPGVMARLERIEWHVGNGNPVPLREMVEARLSALETGGPGERQARAGEEGSSGGSRDAVRGAGVGAGGRRIV